MLQLFKHKNNPTRPVKPKKEDESFDFDSFLTNVIPHKEKQDEDQSGQENWNAYDISKAPERARPIASQKPDTVEKIPKDLEKASKKLNQSIKKLVSNAAETSRPAQSKPVLKEPRKGSAELARNNPVKPKQPGEKSKYHESSLIERKPKSLNSPNIDILHGGLKEGHTKKDTLYSSPQSNAQKRISKPKTEDGLLEPVKKSKDLDKARVSREGSAAKKSSSLNYDPLDLYDPAPVRTEKPRKVNLAESYEIYDPLDVAPVVKRSPKGDIYSEIDKKLFEHSNGSEYEAEVSKKLKLEDGYRKEAAHNNSLRGLKKKVALKSNEHNDRLQYPKGQRGADTSSDEFGGGEMGEEAQKELSKMFSGYRKKLLQGRHAQDDSSDMEAGFDEIQEEDDYSAWYGEQEDQEQEKLIALEQRRERKGNTH